MIKYSKELKSSSKPVTESHKSSVAHDIKNSYIQNLHMKSSMFMLWIISTVLAYAHKIPYIKRIIGLLSLVYGRTTVWKILVKLRKAFIIFNAVIGMYVVFKTTGFGVDTFWANFVGLGHSYIEIFINFTKRLFNWLLELMGYEMKPAKPSIPKGGNLWFPRGIEPGSYYPLPDTNKISSDWLKSPININVSSTPWYKDLSTILWVGGILAGGVAIVGVTYFVIKIIQDPSIILSLGRGDVASNVTPPSSDGSTTPTSEGGSIILAATKSIVKGITTNLKKLNPAYWFLTSSDNSAEAAAFVNNQRSVNYMKEYYPFTKLNPYDSWITRMRIHYLGETISEEFNRELIKTNTLKQLIPKASEASTSVASSSTLTVTPHVGTLGLGLNLDPGFQSVAEKLFSAPPTSGLRPLTHLVSENPFDGLGSAVNRLKNLPFNEELDDSIDNVITPQVQSYAKVAAANRNRYEGLSEENI